MASFFLSRPISHFPIFPAPAIADGGRRKTEPNGFPAAGRHTYTHTHSGANTQTANDDRFMASRVVDLWFFFSFRSIFVSQFKNVILTTHHGFAGNVSEAVGMRPSNVTTAAVKFQTIMELILHAERRTNSPQLRCRQKAIIKWWNHLRGAFFFFRFVFYALIKWSIRFAHI